jgi:hypothetical protein
MFTVGLDVIFDLVRLNSDIFWIAILTNINPFFSLLTASLFIILYIVYRQLMVELITRNPFTDSFRVIFSRYVSSLKGVIIPSPYLYITLPVQSSVMPNLSLRLNPFFVSGFTDAEGSFIISISRSSRYKVGWSAVACFQIVLHIKDLDLLYKIQEFFKGVGSITINKNRCNYIVNGHSDLINVIIPHFDAFPLISKKQADYLLFRKALLDFIQPKKHLTLSGIEGLVAIRASMNLGWKENLKESFPLVTPIMRPEIGNQSIPHGMWMAGFMSGEGCFFVHTRSTSRTVSIYIKIGQHERDHKLIKSFVEYFGGGRYYKPLNEKMCIYICEKFSDIFDNIIPFKKKIPYSRSKSQRFFRFRNYC